MIRRACVAFMISSLVATLCLAQPASPKLLLRVDRTTSGPFGGQKGASCLMLYSGGRVVYSWMSTSAIGVEDEHGNVTHPETGSSLEFKFSERDVWEFDSFAGFLKSKTVQRLDSYFPPPHSPIDYFETSTLQISLPDEKPKQIQTREYYVASFEEKARYPSALIIIMDKIEQLRVLAANKGTSTEQPVDCKFEPARSTTKQR